ncbi:hypothetical protein [Chitinophaga sp. RAB17]|uniref:hypothetical protein n=1 Tax=Chitinophaga sp. RAB17 TaxID=3233049 RepID=UPI003F9176B4
MRYIKHFFMLVVLTSGCSRETEEDKMRRTTNDIVATIEKDQFTDFRFFIGPKLLFIGKDDVRVFDDFTKFKGLLGASGEKKDITINITDLYNDMGQRIVDIPIKSAHTTSPDSIYHLNLLFGPPNIFPLNKITGYKLTRGNVIPEGFHKMEKPVSSGK